jgi:hypothetical protein
MRSSSGMLMVSAIIFGAQNAAAVSATFVASAKRDKQLRVTMGQEQRRNQLLSFFQGYARTVRRARRSHSGTFTAREMGAHSSGPASKTWAKSPE